MRDISSNTVLSDILNPENPIELGLSWAEEGAMGREKIRKNTRKKRGKNYQNNRDYENKMKIRRQKEKTSSV